MVWLAILLFDAFLGSVKKWYELTWQSIYAEYTEE